MSLFNYVVTTCSFVLSEVAIGFMSMNQIRPLGLLTWVYILETKSRVKICGWEGVRYPTPLNPWADLY